MNKLTNSPDDLDYLASQGFEKSGSLEKEIEQINSKLDRKYSGFKFPIFLSGIILGGIVVALFFIFKPSQKSDTVGQTVNTTESSTNKDEPLIVNDSNSITVSENKKSFENNNAQNSKEHFSKINIDNHFAENLSIENMSSIQVNKIAEAKEMSQKDLLEMLPNASVVFIYDLKITNYQSLYFKAEKPFALRNGGLQSHYENISGFSNKSESAGHYTLVEILKQSLNEFNLGNHKKALGLFNVLLEFNVADVNARFYAALCQHHLGYSSAAIKSFDQVLEDKNNVFHQESNWYKALALLQAGEKEKATDLLIRITEQNGFYSAQAFSQLK